MPRHDACNFRLAMRQGRLPYALNMRIQNTPCACSQMPCRITEMIRQINATLNRRRGCNVLIFNDLQSELHALCEIYREKYRDKFEKLMPTKYPFGSDDPAQRIGLALFEGTVNAPLKFMKSISHESLREINKSHKYQQLINRTYNLEMKILNKYKKQCKNGDPALQFFNDCITVQTRDTFVNDHTPVKKYIRRISEKTQQTMQNT